VSREQGRLAERRFVLRPELRQLCKKHRSWNLGISGIVASAEGLMGAPEANTLSSKIRRMAPYRMGGCLSTDDFRAMHSLSASAMMSLIKPRKPWITPQRQ
jgi:hypothetical protein